MQNVKKVASVVFLIIVNVLIFGIGAMSSSAQKNPDRSPNPDSYLDYVYNLDSAYEYRKAYEDYRTKYQAYQTAQSKEDALKSSIDMLEQSRYTLVLYVDLLSSFLSDQKDVNPRVKNAILNDLAVHKDFLLKATDTIKQITSLDQSKEVSNGMNLRFNYIKTTATQTLQYSEGNDTYDQLKLAQELVQKINNVVQSYPESSREKNIVQKWVNETNTKTTSLEKELTTYIDRIYEDTTATQASKKYFEERGATGNQTVVSVQQELKNLISKYKEMSTILKDGYDQL